MLKVSLSYELMSHLYEKDWESEQMMLALAWLEKIHAEIYVDDLTLLLLWEDGKISKKENLPFKNVRVLKIKDFSYFSKEDKEILYEWYSVYLRNTKYQLLKNERKQIWDLFHLRANMGHLQCLKQGKIDMVLSEDPLLFAMANKVGTDQYIYTLSQFLDRCDIDYPQQSPFRGISIHKVKFEAVDVEDAFFNSFRQEYPRFNEWFATKKNDTAYVVWDEHKKVRAFLYLKLELCTEDYSMISPCFSSAKRLKIGSFKVDLHGARIFERFLYIVFDIALREHVNEIYITLFPKYKSRLLLNEQLQRWGFYYWGTKGKEAVLVKDYRKHDNGKYRQCYPFYKIPSQAFLICLDEKYEEALFGHNDLSCNFDENLYPIRKIIICRGLRNGIQRSDVLFFYSLAEHRIAHIGLVEDVLCNFKSEKDFVFACKKRSIFSNNQLIRYWNFSKHIPFAVKFLNSYTVPFNDSVKMEPYVQELKANEKLTLSPIDKQIFNQMIKGTDYEKYIIAD